jgi:nucleoside-diphosphate-sugar epimerase
MYSKPVVIFGLGFTGRQVAKRLAQQGIPVFAPGRGDSLADIPKRARILHTVPPLDPPENEVLRQRLASLAPLRVVYISSTGVYGAQTSVDSGSIPAPEDERAERRLAEEQWVATGPWSSLILRSAAIYGPSRGVHVAAREGRLPRGSGSGIVSRIHVCDLAAIADAGLFSSIEGAWPVADEHPSPSDEIIRYVNPHFAVQTVPARVAGRCVDGSHIREVLGITLIYPSWESGIPASLAEEARQGDASPEKEARSEQGKPEQTDLLSPG